MRGVSGIQQLSEHVLAQSGCLVAGDTALARQWVMPKRRLDWAAEYRDISIVSSSLNAFNHIKSAVSSDKRTLVVRLCREPCSALIKKPAVRA